MTQEFFKLAEDISRADISVLSAINATNIREAKAEFLANPNLRTPNFVYGNLNTEALETSAMDCSLLKASIPRDTLREHFILNYLVTFTLYRIKFLIAIDEYLKDPNIDTHNKYHEANTLLYGLPDQTRFQMLLQEELAKMPVEYFRKEDEIKYEQLKSSLNFNQLPQSTLSRPSPELVSQFREMIWKYFERFLKYLPKDSNIFKAEDVLQYVNNILKYEVREKGIQTRFNAEIFPNNTIFDVEQLEGIIKIPGNRALGDYSRDDMIALITGHEIGTHLFRSINAEKYNLRALYTGLPRYESFEEGLAKAVELALRGIEATAKEPSRPEDHYINIGLVNFYGKDFRDVYEIRHDINFLRGVTPGETDEDRARRSQDVTNIAFNQTRRCFRGTPDQPNHKDLIYVNGSIQAWTYISDHIHDSNLMSTLFESGKNNPYVPEHRYILDCLRYA